MRYGSVCSGIEAATMAWHHMGWEPAFFSEIEAFPRAVLEHRYPEVPLHGDFTTIEQNQYGKIDLLVGGTPCQSFSVAGLRGGLDDERGNLALEFCRLAQRERPRWIVWENVPGVLSSNGGRDFGSILGALEDLGYGLAYRVLDAQYFGVAQRRRRVFVVGYLGDWRRAAAVLFERHSLSGHPAPRREKGQGVARSLRAQSQSSHREDSDNFAAVAGGQRSSVKWAAGTANAITSSLANSGTGHNKDENVIAFDCYNQQETSGVSKTVAARNDQDTASCVAYAIQERAISENPDAGPDGIGIRSDDVAYTMEARTVPQAVATFSEDGTARTLTRRYDSSSCADRGPDVVAFERQRGSTQNLEVTDGFAPALIKSQTPAVAFDMRGREGGAQFEGPHDTANIRAASGGSSRSYVAASAVRRLTPVECERLQGFPDGFTAIPWRKKNADQCPDGPRYKALGNSMAVPVMRWIGERIQMVDDLIALI
ncbi:MAG: hypothetical protein RLZZ387_2591 [Chloroflexota bacterium]|jgi:DNA (cytosine-5)-methyltransferase 1